MKKRKYLFSFLLVSCLVFASVVKAATPDNFTLLKPGGNSLNYNGNILYGDPVPAYFTNKYYGSNQYLVLCTGDRDETASEGTTFNKTSFTSPKVGAGVAAIIKEGVGENAKYNVGDSKIYFTQIAIWKYLETYYGDNRLSWTFQCMNTTQKNLVDSYVNLARQAETTYNNINNFSASLSATSLNFTLDGNVYKSQVINVTGNQIKTVVPSVNIGTVEASGSGYVVSVPKTSLTSEQNTVTLSFNIKSNSIAVAANYSNGRSDEQTTTTTNFDYFSKSATKSVSGTIKVDKPTISISKQDATTGKELPGATLILKDANGTEKLRWVSTNSPKIIDSLAPGKYTLTELIAPDGYVKSSETITFTIDSQGKLVDGPVVMKNKLKDKVDISKQDATTGKELPGATLVLKDSNGKEVAKWVSGNTPHRVGPLGPGKYTLTETIAPDGYVKSSETVTFTVKEDGTVAEPVVMKNKPKEPIINPQTGTSIFGISLLVAFIAFAVSFYFYADYKVKSNM